MSENQMENRSESFTISHAKSILSNIAERLNLSDFNTAQSSLEGDIE